jgi:hypothetical protein
MMQDLPEPPEPDNDVRDTSRRDRIISIAIAIAVVFALGAVAGQATSGGDAAKTAPVAVPAPTTASGGHLEPGETPSSGGAEAICEAQPELESCGGTGSRRVVTITKTKTITETAETTKAAAPKAFSFGDGTYRVGPAGVPPGTYKAPGGGSCYWERLSGFSGELNDIIANDVATRNPIVTIAPSDAGFNTSDCGTWKRV